ncbi:hypothetical protein BDZ91DRAFT_766261 [Kalaharituber pfeilii]|nr:hypothetical protein BDZ91DRAFT_766261 [Kalaharituber pfeilii]
MALNLVLQDPNEALDFMNKLKVSLINVLPANLVFANGCSKLSTLWTSIVEDLVRKSGFSSNLTGTSGTAATVASPASKPYLKASISKRLLLPAQGDDGSFISTADLLSWTALYHGLVGKSGDVIDDFLMLEKLLDGEAYSASDPAVAAAQVVVAKVVEAVLGIKDPNTPRRSGPAKSKIPRLAPNRG